MAKKQRWATRFVARDNYKRPFLAVVTQVLPSAGQTCNINVVPLKEAEASVTARDCMPLEDIFPTTTP